MRSSVFFSLALVPAVFVAACGNSGGTTSTDAGTTADAHSRDAHRAGHDAGHDAPPPSPDTGVFADSATPPDSGKTPDSGHAPDAARDAGSCKGTAPDCFGNDSTSCCGQDPEGVAKCVRGAWLCGAAAAPGCNGHSCIEPADSGHDAGHHVDSGVACGTIVDGGAGISEVSGSCPGTQQCCSGGAVDSFYCYAGDGGCPEVP
jgi:hypothetical protein